MPYVDIAVLLSIATGTGAALWLLRARGARKRRLLLGGWAAFQGATLVAMMTAHSVEILYHLAAGHETIAGTPWRYDFRTYSLLLLGAVLSGVGIHLLRLAAALGRGEGGARRRGVWTELALLAVVAPLIPVHAFFGVILTTLAGLGVIILLLARPERHAEAAPLRLVAVRPRPAPRRPLALVR
jgi:hypothetical protein